MHLTNVTGVFTNVTGVWCIFSITSVSSGQHKGNSIIDYNQNYISIICHFLTIMYKPVNIVLSLPEANDNIYITYKPKSLGKGEHLLYHYQLSWGENADNYIVELFPSCGMSKTKHFYQHYMSIMCIKLYAYKST